MNIFNRVPLLYSFVRDVPEDGHVETETLRRHVVKWHDCCWLCSCWITCCL